MASYVFHAVFVKTDSIVILFLLLPAIHFEIEDEFSMKKWENFDFYQIYSVFSAFEVNKMCT